METKFQPDWVAEHRRVARATRDLLIDYMLRHGNGQCGEETAKEPSAQVVALRSQDRN